MQFTTCFIRARLVTSGSNKLLKIKPKLIFIKTQCRAKLINDIVVRIGYGLHLTQLLTVGYTRALRFNCTQLTPISS